MEQRILKKNMRVYNQLTLLIFFKRVAFGQLPCARLLTIQSRAEKEYVINDQYEIAFGAIEIESKSFCIFNVYFSLNVDINYTGTVRYGSIYQYTPRLESQK